MKETTYQLFCAIEDELRVHLQAITSTGKKSKGKAEMISNVTIKMNKYSYYYS